MSELLAKGVARETINLVVGERDPDAELTQAREAIRRPITRWATLDTRERKRKIQQYLAARGFSYDTIEAVIARPQEETYGPVASVCSGQARWRRCVRTRPARRRGPHPPRSVLAGAW